MEGVKITTKYKIAGDQAEKRNPDGLETQERWNY
jgi:hypothetical protein